MPDTLPSRLLASLPEIVSRIEKTYPYGSVLAADVEELGIRVDRAQENVWRGGPQRGAVLTGFDGVEVREVVTVALTPDGLARAAQDLATMAPPSAGRVSGEMVSAVGAAGVAGAGRDAGATVALPPGAHSPAATDPAAVPLPDKLDLCRAHRDRGLALDPRCQNATATYQERLERRVFADRAGVRTQTSTKILVGVSVHISDGGPPRSDHIARGGEDGLEITRIPEADWAVLAETLPALLQAQRLEPGFYDIIVAPDVAGLIAHEAFGHGVEMDMFVKDRARSRDYLGRSVGSTLVDMYDDPTYPGGFGSHLFDDEGQPAARVQIIREGVFLGGLTDLYSASRLGVPRTSNGRRESFQRKAYARMTNTYFGPGKDTLPDMIASVDRGVYLGRSLSGMEDPKGWGIQVQTVWGREIKNGRLTGRWYSPVGLTGYVPDLLGSISMVGSDSEVGPGYCGKGYKEFIPIGMGGPHLKAKARLT